MKLQFSLPERTTILNLLNNLIWKNYKKNTHAAEAAEREALETIIDEL